ncbi:MAG: transcriptional regulator [Flavobacteriia bacterium]
MSKVLNTLLLLAFLSAVFTSTAQSSEVKEALKWVNSNVQSDPEKCLLKLQELENYSDPKNIEDRYVILEELSNFYLVEMKNFKECMFWMKKLEKEVLRSKNLQYEIRFHNSLGKLYYFNNNNLEKSFAEFTKALNLLQKNNSHYLEEVIHSNYSLSLQADGQYYKSLKQQHLALNIVKAKNDFWLQSIVTHNMGVNFLHLNKIDSAEIYFNRSYVLATKTPELIDDAQRSLYLGLYYRDKKDENKSLSYLLTSFKTIHAHNTFADKLNLCNALSELYKAKNDKSNALKYKELQIAFTDSSEKYKLNHEQFVFEQNLKLKSLKTKAKLSEFENSKYILQLIVSGLLALSLLLLLFYLIIRHRKNRQLHFIEKQKAEIEKQNINLEKEIEERESKTKAMFLMEKDNLINEIVNKLNQALPDVKEDQQNFIGNVIHDLKGNVDNKRSEEFEAQFKKAHPHFFENLTESHPKLSPNEKKLCAFLSLNMNTKEIAAITGQTAHSINIARGRLRKKLKIDHTEIQISDFLSKFNK